MLKNCFSPGICEAGCDEAGRGCLAGPVFAAAVVLPDDYRNPLLNDSKKMTSRVRERVRHEIEQDALAWSVSWVDNHTIDEINILGASILAMHQALDKLPFKPGHILVDGNRFISYQNIPYSCIIKGDATYASIAAASVLAKTWRDEYMLDLHEKISIYGWDRNKGYPTAEHREAIKKFGVTFYHRKSFSMLDQQFEYKF